MLSSSFLCHVGFDFHDSVSHSNIIQVYGIEYKINSFIAIHAGDDSTLFMPKFRKIIEIIVDDKNNVLFYYQIWSSEYFDEFLNAFHVKAQ